MGCDAREAVELAQRFDVELETVFHFNFYGPGWFGGVAGHRRLLRLMTENTYDVYIFQDISPAELGKCWLGKGALEALKPAVERGTGVVLIGTDDGETLKDRKALEAPPGFLENGPVLEAAALGKGRIARLPARPAIGYKVGWQVDYENWQEQVGRAMLWAANREPRLAVGLDVPDKIARAQLPGKAVTVSWDGADPKADCAAQVTLRRWDGVTWDLGRIECKRAKGSAAVQLPKLRAGDYHVDVILAGRNGVETFATRPFAVTDPIAVADVKLAGEWGEIGDKLACTVTVTGAAEGQTLRVRLVDRRGRVLVRKDEELGGAGGMSRDFEFGIEPWLPMLVRVEAVVLDKDGEAASDYRFFNVTKRNREKFNFVLWGFPTKGTLAPYAAQTMKRLGVTAILSSRAAPKAAAAYDIAWVPWTGGQIRTGPHTEGWHSDNSVNYFIMRMKESRGHGVLTYSLGDEGPVEGAGVGPPAMKAYRDYLQQQYRDIAGLNDSWGTEFKSFDDVVLTDPKDTHEKKSLKEGNYPRWYDRQAFKSYNFVEYCKRHRDKLLEFDSKALLGFEGSGRFARRGDPDLICRELKFWVPYGGSLDELVRSLTADKPYFLRGNWMGYHRTADGLANKYWRMVASGSSSVWWWMWSTIGAWQGLIAPDLGCDDYVQEFVDDTAIVRNGLGPILQRAAQQHDGIATLHSHPSAYAATVDKNKTFQDYEPNHRIWFNVIHDQPMEFRYVTGRMLRLGEFEADKFRILILPQALALSDAEAKVISDFAAAGGTVIADLRPGVYNEHLKPRDAGVLDALFGIKGAVRRSAQPADIQVEGKLGEKDLALKWSDMRVDPGVQLAGATALGRAGDVPVCIVNDAGKGKAILLNWAMSGFPSRTSARGLRTWGTGQETPSEVVHFFRRLFEEAGVHRPLELLKYKSKQPYVGNIRTQRWRTGNIEILALHKESGERQQVTVALKDERHVYDLRDQVYVGKTGRWMNQIIPSRARFFALLPERCPALQVVLPKNVRRGTVIKATVSIPAAAGLHAVKITVALPDGTPAEWLDQTVITDQAVKEVALPIAYNDPPGTWTLTATDVYTRDTEQVLTFEVK